jgi:hypothetical protein
MTADNPYASPNAPNSNPSVRSWNLFRGLAYAVSLGALGSCVPFIAMGGLKIIGVYDFPWREFPGKLWLASCGCSIVFFFSALANYTPRQGIGFVRALMIMGILAVAAVFVVAMIIPVRNYIDPNERLRYAVHFAMLAVSGVIFTVWQISRHRRLSRSSDSRE